MGLGVWILIITVLDNGVSITSLPHFTDHEDCSQAAIDWDAQMRKVSPKSGWATICVYSGDLISKDRKTQQLPIVQKAKP